MQDATTPMSQRLESFLASVEGPRRPTVLSYEPIIGGYSRLTAVAQVRWEEGEDEKLIVRSDPPEGQGVFSSERDPEWQLLQALAGLDTIVIPRPRWYDGSGEFFPTKTIIMQHCEGVPLQSLIQTTDDTREATELLLEVAAAIHTSPLDGLPPDMPRPRSWDAYIDGAIEIYERAERDLPDSSPVIRYVVAWLRTHRPPEIPLGLVHGDFQPGNILVAEGRAPVVIDWEFTRIGDPREDIGYYSQSPLPRNLYEDDPEGFLRRYRELTGLSESELNRDVVAYFFILGMAKLFVQMLEGAAGLALGTKTGVLNSFLVNSVAYFQNEYLKICQKDGHR
jgi:aminoglycoside phosphotransferase (APT) family kinase protein